MRWSINFTLKNRKNWLKWFHFILIQRDSTDNNSLLHPGSFDKWLDRAFVRVYLPPTQPPYQRGRRRHSLWDPHRNKDSWLPGDDPVAEKRGEIKMLAGNESRIYSWVSNKCARGSWEEARVFAVFKVNILSLVGISVINIYDPVQYLWESFVFKGSLIELHTKNNRKCMKWKCLIQRTVVSHKKLLWNLKIWN